MKKILLLAAGILFSGCHSSSFLNTRTTPERADFGDNAIMVPSVTLPPHIPIINADPSGITPALPQDVITGTWSFTTPATMTRIEHKTDNYSQFSLYEGRPAPNDTPMVLITVSNDPRTFAQTESQKYMVTNHREYALNGAVAEEWSGNTSTGEGFCELLVKKPTGSGDFCHAIAIAKTPEQRKLGLEILASISWKGVPAGPGARKSDTFLPALAMAAAQRERTTMISYIDCFEKRSDGSYSCIEAIAAR